MFHGSCGVCPHRQTMQAICHHRILRHRLVGRFYPSRYRVPTQESVENVFLVGRFIEDFYSYFETETSAWVAKAALLSWVSIHHSENVSHYFLSFPRKSKFTRPKHIPTPILLSCVNRCSVHISS